VQTEEDPVAIGAEHHRGEARRRRGEDEVGDPGDGGDQQDEAGDEQR
jgi:hypothetical protein